MAAFAAGGWEAIVAVVGALIAMMDDVIRPKFRGGEQKRSKEGDKIFAEIL